MTSGIAVVAAMPATNRTRVLVVRASPRQHEYGSIRLTIGRMHAPPAAAGTTIDHRQTELEVSSGAAHVRDDAETEHRRHQDGPQDVSHGELLSRGHCVNQPLFYHSTT